MYIYLTERRYGDSTAKVNVLLNYPSTPDMNKTLDIKQVSNLYSLHLMSARQTGKRTRKIKREFICVNRPPVNMCSFTEVT